MARARNIKPGFFKNEDLAECSPWARLCFAGLWTLADREGRLEDRGKRIKGELFAYDTVDVEPLLRELERHRFIVRYAIDGASFIEISKFKEHQTPHYSEKPSVIKPPGFQEPPPHQVTPTPRVEPASRGEPNPLNPDSLNPDSPNLTPAGVKARKRAATPDRPEGVSEQTWADFLALRRAKKAPVTATVLAGALAEAEKAGWPLEAFFAEWCRRGTQGLKADWLTESKPRGSVVPINRQLAIEAENKRVGAEWLAQQGVTP